MTKRPIAFRRKALEDIGDIVQYLAVETPRAARDFRAALEHACELLADMPDIGMLRSFGHPKLTDLRLWPLKRFEKYLLVYRTQAGTIDVIRVLPGARDLPALFQEPDG